MLEEVDVIMSEVDVPCGQTEKSRSLAPSQTPNNLSSVSSAVSHLSIEGDTSVSLGEVVESSIDSPVLSSDNVALSPSDVALLDGPDPEVSDSLPKIPKS